MLNNVILTLNQYDSEISDITLARCQCDILSSQYDNYSARIDVILDKKLALIDELLSLESNPHK